MSTAVEAPPFEPWPKIARLNRDVVITEKIDGTNAQVVIEGDRIVAVGSRKRWITPEQDNFGFARWAYAHEVTLVSRLGEGRHYGEWWGQGIQRGYGLDHKRFSVFNAPRFEGLYYEMHDGTVLTHVPILKQHTLDTEEIEWCLHVLREMGSQAAPGYDNPEGVIVYHTAANVSFKVTLEGDEKPKGQQ